MATLKPQTIKPIFLHMQKPLCFFRSTNTIGKKNVWLNFRSFFRQSYAHSATLCVPYILQRTSLAHTPHSLFLELRLILNTLRFASYSRGTHVILFIKIYLIVMGNIYWCSQMAMHCFISAQANVLKSILSLKFNTMLYSICIY